MQDANLQVGQDAEVDQDLGVKEYLRPSIAKEKMFQIMKQGLKRDQDLNHLNAMVMPIIAYTTIVYFMNSQLCACTIFCTACSVHIR